MSQASRDSLAQLHTELKATLSAGGVELGAELFAALKVIDENGALRRSITDPTVEANRRQELIRKIFANKVSANAVTVLQNLAGVRWTTEREFGDALEEMAATTAIYSAEQGGLAGLKTLTQQLLEFNRVVEASHELQRALTDHQAPVSSRGDLADNLMSANALNSAKLLVRQAVENPRGVKPVDLVRRFADLSAQQQRQWIADVTVARPLQQAQLDRLAGSLSSTFGRQLQLNVHTDPQLIGGIRIQVGDEVIDSSVASRLNDLNTKLAG
ncbi:F0F1 ATP synthase subunit delta [Enteractinococcus helveticum]|uniref:ATP synthase subunit delta n=1 Tax=Enteractinococcus helveticum TaxID=1837282 RepID=A0A1B7M1U0_9MICC|nr:F0F1 ATP synthase subunit delta [Enteractinococcus helveticum]OAV62541.1 F0F1 ATP synthase subunit delta [Enteractinococcus helveticum]